MLIREIRVKKFSRLGCGGRSRRRGRCAGVSAAGVHDDAGAFPGFNEAFAGVRAVELQGEVVHVGCQLHEGGGVGLLECRRSSRDLTQNRARNHQFFVRANYAHRDPAGVGGNFRRIFGVLCLV